jgi:hypothetical protein
MKPPTNRIQRIHSSLLRQRGSTAPGMHIVLLAEPDAALLEKLANANIDPEALLNGQRPASLRSTPGLPHGPLLVLDAEQLPVELLPPPAPIALALAVLALSSDTLYDHRRPLVLTTTRLRRRIVLCQPHRYHDVL